MILGFLWSLFKRYRIATIKHQDKSSEEGLLAWCKQTTEGYRGVSIETYKNSFKDGMAFLALVDKFLDSKKEILDFDSFTKETALDNLTTAFDTAEKQLGIPKLLEPQEVLEGNVDERSMVLYISLYFHAFVAKQQQKLLEEQKSQIEEKMRGLEGSLEQRAKMGAELVDENGKLQKEIEALKQELEKERAASADLRDKNNYLEERVEVFKQLLEQEQEELNKTKQDLDKKGNDLSELKLTLEDQISSLQGQVTQLNTKYDQETTARKQEFEQNQARSQVELKGLGVLKRNFEEHIEDLKRWQKYLDLDKESSVDFSGEIRPQIISDISKENFDEQLQYISKKLEKENVDLVQLLKQKEAEVKAKKAQEEKKKERQKKNDN